MSHSTALVAHARVGETAMWLTRLIARRGRSRRAMSFIMSRFSALYVPSSLPALQERFMGASYALAHPSEHGLDESLAAAQGAVRAYVVALCTRAAAHGAQDAFEDAVRRGDLDAAQRCVAATVDASDLNGTTALMVAAREGHAEMVSWLLAIGASPTAQDVFGETYLAHGHSFKIEV